MSTSDRRTGERYLAMVPLLITVAGNLYRKPVRLRSRDISEGGLSFVTRSRIPIDANSRVIVSPLGDLPEDARIEGRVVHCSKNEDEGRYTVGIEFERFVGVTRDEVVARLEPWERSSTQRRLASR